MLTLKTQKKFAVLTCGGVCPGMNDVVRSITLTSMNKGVHDVYGVRYGFTGLHIDTQENHMKLSRDIVQNMHMRGGSMLGTSREKLHASKAIETLLHRAYDVLFVVGGNGGNTAAAILNDQLVQRGLPIQVIGLPKSIDNDIDLIDMCFGFQTAVYETQKVLEIARNEANAVYKGVVVVKVMGRDSGFIAHHAIGSDICLIPEMGDITLDTITEKCHNVLSRFPSCVICVAEGFWKDAFDIHAHLQKQGLYTKYIDPSYIIRGGVTTPSDHAFCNILGEAAVKAAIDGHTGITVGTKGGRVQYFDTRKVVSKVKKVKL